MTMTWAPSAACHRDRPPAIPDFLFTKKIEAQGLWIAPNVVSKLLGAGHQREELSSRCSAHLGEATRTTSVRPLGPRQ